MSRNFVLPLDIIIIFSDLQTTTSMDPYTRNAANLRFPCYTTLILSPSVALMVQWLSVGLVIERSLV